MKHFKILSILFLVASTILTFSACGGDDSPVQPITVGNPSFTNILQYSAEVSATVAGDITERGILYATNNDPKSNGQKVPSTDNNIHLTLTGLTAGTTYYVCTYAKNSRETKYSEALSFTTQAKTPKPTTRLVGGDISLLTKYEEHGAKYLDKNGNDIKQKYGNMLDFFKQQGMNAMRVRLFVDPKNATKAEKGQGVCQDLNYVIALGKRIKAAGMQFMLDFHYSDTWADPVKQWTPQSWVSLSDDQLYVRIYEYTKDCLSQLKAAGATPDLIQTGNEISYGMLYGKGIITKDVYTDTEHYTEYKVNDISYKKVYTDDESNWNRFTNLLKQAGKACREICPDAKIIIHTERIEKPSIQLKFYENMASYGVDYDVIGLSYYPYFHGKLEDMDKVLTTLENTFKEKEIMVVETGYYHKWQPQDVKYNLTEFFPDSEIGQQNYAIALNAILKTNHPRVTGLFWWFMEANECGLNWETQRVTDDWYNASLFDNETGKALPALYELQNFK